jgi:predicted methyltransferase/DNA-directed RNA polymerase subunit RPC12/RpoP
MEHPEDVLQHVAQSARLREGPAGVEAFLRQLHRESPLPTGELARRLGWPVPVTAAVRGELERAGLVARTPGGVALSAAGQTLVREVLGLATREDPLCPTCSGRRIYVDPVRWESLLARLEEVHRRNPAVDTTLDQSHGTPETALRRALAMVREGALEGRDVLILGDDDLVSVAIGLLAAPRPPVTLSPPHADDGEIGGQGDGVKTRRLTVVDIDPRFLSHIAAAGRELGFPVETVEHDLREPLPEELRAAFDTVETDPPYTLAGLRLFLARGLEALRPGGGRDLFLSYAPRDPDGQRALLAACVDLGLAPYSVLPDFNRYAGAATLGGSSQFLHVRTTVEAGPAVAGRYDGPLYTMEERLAGAASGRPAARTYRCLACGTEVRVGPGEGFTTIETLKGRGCPQCGEKRFRAGRRSS